MMILGIGLRETATFSSLLKLYTSLHLERKPDGIATWNKKSTHRALHHFAQELGFDIVDFPLESIQEQNTESETKLIKSPSIAEATALLGAGEKAKLVLKKTISEDGLVTMALASDEGREK